MRQNRFNWPWEETAEHSTQAHQHLCAGYRSYTGSYISNLKFHDLMHTLVWKAFQDDSYAIMAWGFHDIKGWKI